MDINTLTNKIIGCAIEVHEALDPDFSNLHMRNALLLNYRMPDYILKGRFRFLLFIRIYI